MNSVAQDSANVQDYIAGRLSAAESEAFEARLSGDSSLVWELEESLRLREGLEVLRDRKVLKRLSRPRYTRVARRFMVAAAAAAVVVVAVGLYFGGYDRRADAIVAVSVAALHSGTGSPLVVARTHVFAALRHEAMSVPNLELPTSGALEFSVLTPITDGDQKFRVSLLMARDGKISRIGGVEHVVPDGDGLVSIYADASKLEPGDYSLSAIPESGNEIPSERFEFGLRR